MPNIGFWATAGASSGGGAAYELIATTAGTGASSTVTFSSIPAGYKHLQIRFSASNTLAYNGAASGYIRFNSDAAANYSAHFMLGNGSGVSSGSEITTNQMPFGYNYGPGVTPSPVILDILDAFATTNNKTLRLIEGYVQSFAYQVDMRSGNWRSTAAITSINILELNGYSWSTTSRFSLYGIKG